MQLKFVKHPEYQLVLLADDRDEYDNVFIPMQREAAKNDSDEPKFVELNNQERTMIFRLLRFSKDDIA